LRQAERDLKQAQVSLDAGLDDWACFASHQAAEKAVKALHLSTGQEAWGHRIAVLLQQLPQALAPEPVLIEKGRVLDSFYVPPRYPNSHAEGAAFEHFGPLQSQEAIQYAREIVEFVRARMA
jgi:HEPN domain-containing protein